MCLPQSMSSSKICGTKDSLQVANSPGRCFRCLGRHSLNPARTKTHTMPEAQVPLQSSHSQTRSPLSFLWVIRMSAFCRPFGSPGSGFVMQIHHRYQILALFTFSVARNGKQPVVCKNQDWNCTENNGVLSKLLSRVWVSVVFISLLTNSGIGSVPASAIEGLACNSIHISTMANIAQ